MSEGTIGLIVIAVFVAVLLFGFLFGLWRGFNKSLVRLLFVVASIVGAFFLAPVVTRWALTFDLSNFGIKIAGESVSTLGELLRALLKDVPYIQDLAETNAYATIMEVVPQMIVNVVMFVVLFYLIRLVSMIIYWIIAGICFSKKKTEGKNKHRLLGSVVGVVQNFAVFLVLLVPVIGAVNIVGEIETIVTQENSSSASTTRTTLSDDNSYVVLMEGEGEGEGESGSSSSGPEGEIVKIYNTVNDVIKIYKNTWVAKFLSGVKLDVVCQGAFDKLSTIAKDGEKFVLKNEVSSAAYVYTDYKAFKELGEIDVTNPKLYEIMKSAINHAYQSRLAAKTIDEIVPLAASKWLAGETFMGISFDSLHISAPYDAVVKSALGVLTDGTKTLSETLTSTADMMKSLAGTAAKVQEAIEEGVNALTPETVTDLLTTLTESPETIELVKDVLLTEDTETGKTNLDNIVDAVFPEGGTTEEQEKIDTIKGAVVEIVTEVLDGATNPDVDTSKEIAVVGSALGLADKIMSAAETETEITPQDVKDAVTDVVNALVDSTVIYNAITGESDLAKVVQEQIAGYGGEVEGENISQWIYEVTTPAEDASQETKDKLAAIRALLTPSA